MSEKIVVPTLGESVTEATVSKWLKSQGDKVLIDEPIVELETDKVNVEVPSPSNGVLGSIVVKEGETVNVGSLLGTISNNSNQTPESPKEIKNYTIELLKKAFSYSDCKNVVLSGGYSLNCVNNYYYVKEFPEYNFFVDPVAHDGGTAIGAALWFNEQK